MSTKTTTVESSTEPRTEPEPERTIESGRFARALTEPMTVAFDGPRSGIAEVEHDGTEYQVELASGRCECADYQFRGESLICKHVLRACLSALFDGEQQNTELVARVARFAREAGCEHDVRGCSGPTTAGPRGLPCQSCINAVRAPNVDEWTVWNRLVAGTQEGR